MIKNILGIVSIKLEESIAYEKCIEENGYEKAILKIIKSLARRKWYKWTQKER